MNWPFRQRPGILPTLPDALNVAGGRTFGGSYSDRDLVDRAQIDGRARIYTSHWGSNSETHLTNEVFGSTAVQQELLGHQLADARCRFETDLEERLPQVTHGRQSALLALRSFESAALARLSLEREICAAGVPVPHVRHYRRVGLGFLIALLAFGELFVLSPAFQVLGLGDAPVGWYLPFNPQELAALSSVVALIILSHALGERRAPPAAEAESARTARGWARALAEGSRGHRLHIAGVVTLILGLTTIRELYFSQKNGGQPIAAVGFLLLNVGVVLAVQHIGRPDDRAMASRWHAAMKHEKACERVYHRELGELTALAGEYNKLVAARAALLGKYWHAMRAVSAEAARQAHLIASSVRLAQPQVVTEQMFPAGVIPPLEAGFPELLENELAELSKDSPIRVYRAVSLDDLHAEFTAFCASLSAEVGVAGQLPTPEDGEDSPVSTEDA